MNFKREDTAGTRRIQFYFEIVAIQHSLVFFIIINLLFAVFRFHHRE